MDSQRGTARLVSAICNSDDVCVWCVSSKGCCDREHFLKLLTLKGNGLVSAMNVLLQM